MLNIDYNNIAIQVLYSLKSGGKTNLASPSSLAVVSNSLLLFSIRYFLHS